MRKLKTYIYVLPNVALVACGDYGSTFPYDEKSSSFKKIKTPPLSNAVFLSSGGKGNCGPRSTSSGQAENLHICKMVPGTEFKWFLRPLCKTRVKYS